MVKHEEQLDLIFKALGDQTRRKMLRRLTLGEASVSELAEPFDMSLAAVSKHLKVLESARMVEKTKDGRNYFCRANLKPLSEVVTVLEGLGSFWRDRLESLDRFLTSELPEENKNAISRKK